MINGFWGAEQKNRIKLSRGDRVTVYSGKFTRGKVLHFRPALCQMFFLADSGDSYSIPFSPGRFYGAGYAQDHQLYLTYTRKWHFYPALICELVRLALPSRLGKKIFLI